MWNEHGKWITDRPDISEPTEWLDSGNVIAMYTWPNAEVIANLEFLQEFDMLLPGEKTLLEKLKNPKKETTRTLPSMGTRTTRTSQSSRKGTRPGMAQHIRTKEEILAMLGKTKKGK